LHAIAIRHHLQERAALATRIPGHATRLRKLLGNGFDLILTHLRFLSVQGQERFGLPTIGNCCLE
jgi:hypothetical protein